MKNLWTSLKSVVTPTPPKPDSSARSNIDELDMSLIEMISPAKMAEKFRAAESGNIHEQQALFDMIEQRDHHVFSELSKRRRALLSIPWKLVPPEDATEAEKEQTKQTEALIRNIPNFKNALFDVTDAIGKGFSYLAIEWGVRDNQNIINKLRFESQTKFTVDENDNNVLRLRMKTKPNGEELVNYAWVKHHHAAISGDLYKSSLFRVLTWIFVFKHYDVKSLASFLETYGMPVRLGKYKGNPTKKDKLTLLRAARDLGLNGYGIMPETMDLEIKEAGRGKSGDFLDVIGYWDKAYSIAILGGTLTSQADGKTATNALGSIHNEVRQELTESDAEQIAETLTSDLVLPIQMFNGMAKPGRYAKFEFELLEEVDQADTANMLKTSVELGMRIPLSWAHKKMQIPIAKDNEDVLTLESTAPVKTSTASASKQYQCQCPSCNQAALKNDPKQDYPSDHVSDQLEKNMETVMAKWLEQIEVMSSKASNLEELKQMILSAFPDIDVDNAARLISDANLSANLAGQFDAEAQSE